VHSPHGEMKL